MAKQKSEHENLIIGKIVLEPLKSEMLFIQKGLNTIAKKYSFLKPEDVIATRQMLIDVFLTGDINNNDSDEVIFDEKAFFDAISDDTKTKIVDETFNRFLSKISIEDLMEEKS